MPTGYHDTRRTSRTWIVAALSSALVTLVVALMVLITVDRMRANRREVRSLRARLSEKHTEIARERREKEQVADAVDRLADAVNAIRAQTGQVRQLAHIGPIDPSVEGGVAAKQVRGRVSPDTARMLDQISRLEDHATVVGDSMKVVTALLRERRTSALATPSLWPVPGFVSSDFGARRSPYGASSEWHPGVDIKVPQGTPVQASGSGEVIFAGRDAGYGNCIIVAHQRNLDTLYGHLSAINVRVGQQVRRGDVIGLVGATGRATGPHLHFEVRVNDQPVEPTRYLTARPEPVRLSQVTRPVPPTSYSVWLPLLAAVPK